MNGLVRKIALLGACGLLMVVASVASAAVPDPAHSSVPAFIRAGGAQTNAGVPDPTLAITITVRDFLNNPISGSNVEINYSNCSDTKLCTAVVAGRTVDCTNRAVRASTNASGQVSVSILGASTNAGTTVPPAIAGGAGSGCIRVYADGIQLATATSIDYDQNGSLVGGNGVNALDLSIAKNDVGASGLGAAYRGRTDYTGDGSVNAADLAALKTVVGNSGLGTGSGAGCAGNPGGVVQPYCP
jgi:hypothetical protein